MFTSYLINAAAVFIHLEKLKVLNRRPGRRAKLKENTCDPLFLVFFFHVIIDFKKTDDLEEKKAIIERLMLKKTHNFQPK